MKKAILFVIVFGLTGCALDMQREASCLSIASTLNKAGEWVSECKSNDTAYYGGLNDVAMKSPAAEVCAAQQDYAGTYQGSVMDGVVSKRKLNCSAHNLSRLNNQIASLGNNDICGLWASPNQSSTIRDKINKEVLSRGVDCNSLITQNRQMILDSYMQQRAINAYSESVYQAQQSGYIRGMTDGLRNNQLKTINNNRIRCTSYPIGNMVQTDCN